MDEQQFTHDWFSKPGDSLLSLMQRREVTAQQLAESLSGGMDVLRGLVAGTTAIDRGTAEALTTTLGGTTEFWLNRQANYERALNRALSEVVDSEVDEWLTRVPVPGAKKGGRLSDSRKRAEVRRRLAFFNVGNVQAWYARYGRIRSETQFRTSPSLVSDEGAIAMWLRQGELEAALVETRSWNGDVLSESLEEIRKLSKISRPARFLPKLRELCAEAGVAFVVVRTPAGCRASGAVRLIRPDKVMVLLSFRYRSDDQFWFTLFHEIGHLLLHGAGSFVDDDETFQDNQEREANEFASTCIIPEARQAEFERLTLDPDSVLRFSIANGIAPGLVVGQMQHRRMIGYEDLNWLKRRWKWEAIEPALA